MKLILNIFLRLMYLLKSAIQFLQIQVESSNVQQMQVCVEINNSLTAFSYSYFQIIQYYKDRSLVVQQQTMKIDENFLKLDSIILKFLLILIQIIVKNSLKSLINSKFQGINFQQCRYSDFWIFLEFKSEALGNLDITCKNIKLEFKHILLRISRILKMCELNKEELKRILQGLNNQIELIDIDLSQFLKRFSAIEQKDLVRQLEKNKIDVYLMSRRLINLKILVKSGSSRIF
ncbi:unnamed protein product [Paramecium primaurelia]|uniref:Transmembrane protein n=1 Tax=Paramecium primaurelia TaxID=5886 RepID=A0A8S1LUM9_PARPR|nr:unnamed protein product [Paramecium primaurelia]